MQLRSFSAFCVTRTAAPSAWVCIQDPEQRHWIQQHVERPYAPPSREEQMQILKRLNAAGRSRPSCRPSTWARSASRSRARSPIAVLDEILEAAAGQLDEVAVGMPHRGGSTSWPTSQASGTHRSSVSSKAALSVDSVMGSGDVKYHLGSEGVYEADSGQEITVYLAANPSHLGRSAPCSKASCAPNGTNSTRVRVPGAAGPDAATPRSPAGGGRRDAQPSQLLYRTGGTGTSSSTIGSWFRPAGEQPAVRCMPPTWRTVQAPIFHVSGDDRACVRVARMVDFRRAFQEGRGHRPGVLPPAWWQHRRPVADQP